MTGEQMAASLLDAFKVYLAAQLKAVEERFAQVVAGIPAGAKGEAGEAGKDAEPVDVQAILAQIPVPKDGAPGKDGASVAPEAVGAMVTDAVGKAVAAIPRAQDGAPGRDAADIEVLPYLSEDRAYARGTWASHKGGLVRAARATDPLDTLRAGETVETKGWHVILNGPAEPSIEQIDERTFAVKFEMTNGKSMERKVSLPVMLYRGIWREGSYVAGDTATWAGSLWHCNEPTTEKPGDGCKSWVLCAKRGRDGKDK